MKKWIRETSTTLGQVEKNDVRRVPNWRVMPRKVQPTGFVIDLENGDIITALVAAIKEMASRVEAEAAWIVTACPFIGDML
jgi:hypothetical protein